MSKLNLMSQIIKMNRITICTGRLPLIELKGKHVIAAFFVGTLVGAIMLYQFQQRMSINV